MTKNPLVHNKDNSTRFFECDTDEGGCGKFTLSVETKTGRAHLYCHVCGLHATRHLPVALTNPSGSASFIGVIPGGHAL